jgi:hypothetical protein
VRESLRGLRRPRTLDLRRSATALVVRLWSGLRNAIGWHQASRRQRFTIALGGLCALSFVTGGALAAAGVGTPGPFAPQTAAANRSLAAAWIVQQVSPDEMVACDLVMCHQLQASGFPAARLKPLPSAASNPLGSGLVVATPAVRGQFGSRLATADAPLVLAGFGSGPDRVEVRVVAPDGAAAFRSQLAAEHAFLVSAGRQLLQDRSIQSAPGVRGVLLDGRVDSRLAATLSVLAAQTPFRLVAFGGRPPGADPAVPLRVAEIGVTSPAATSAILAFLHAQQGVYRPAAVSVTGSADQALITVRFDAPGPMGPGLT